MGSNRNIQGGPCHFLLVSVTILVMLSVACDFDQRGGAGSSAVLIENIRDDPGNPSESKGNATSFDTDILEPCIQFPVTVRHAHHFTVRDHDVFRVLTVDVPWAPGGKPFQYVLIPRGAEPPAEFPGALVVEVPVQSVAALSTTYLPYLDQFGLIDRLVGVHEASTVSTPAVRQRIEQGLVEELGIGTSVNMERLIDLDPELIMTYGIGEADQDYYQLLLDAGMPVVLTAEFLEPTPLARAEWGKFVALFFGREQKAERAFSEIEERYLGLSDRAVRIGHRPTVLLNAHFQGTWYVSGGNTFAAAFLADAGAHYLWEDDPSTVSRPLAAEVVFESGADAEYWLNPGQAKTMEELLSMDQRYDSFSAVRNCRVYSNSALVNDTGGNDYWETGMANPHLVLADLIRIFHPELLPDHKPRWYRRLDCQGEGES